mgnify:CR=1 FL=1
MAIPMGALGQGTFNRNYGPPAPMVDVGGCPTTVEYDGHLYFTATRWNTANGLISASFTKLNTLGEVIGGTVITDTARGYSPQTFAMCLDHSGFIAGGQRPIYSYADTFITGLLIRYDLMGDTLWTREIVIDDSSRNILWLYGLDVDQTGNIVVAGTIVHDASPPYNDALGETYLMKADPNGNKLWEQVYAPLNSQQVYDVIQISPTSGYFIVGYIREYYDIVHDKLTTFLIKTDGSGNEVAYQDLDLGFSVGCTNISRTADNAFVVGGTIAPTSGFDYAGSITKMDSSGMIIWDRRYSSHPQSEYEWISGIVQLADGSFACSGGSIDTLDFSNEGWIMKVDNNGYLLWERFFNFNEYPDYFNTITALSDGGILATGNCYDNVGMSNQVWLVKLDSLGCDSTGCPEAYHTGVPNLRPVDGIYLVVAPNPFKGATEIRWAWPAQARQCQLLIHDLSGREVLRNALDPNVACGALHFEAPGSGAYVASLVADGRVVQTMKLVCE